MPERTSGSTVPRRQLGRYLRDLRNQARLTVRKAATVLEWSEAKIWRIETGQTSMRKLDVEAMCRMYGASEDLTEALMALASETKAKGWWHSYGDVIPEDFDVYIGLEEAASAFRWYESELVPGLFQTEEYARALIRSHKAGGAMASEHEGEAPDEDESERRVQLRIARQTLVTRKTAPPAMHVVLNEAILRRPVGGAGVMAAQLERLEELSQLPHIDLRVLPFAAGVHRGITAGPFVMLTFPLNGEGKATEPPTVYIDGLTGALYLDKSHEVSRYEDAFQGMQEAALDAAASRDLIHHAATEIRK